MIKWPFGRGSPAVDGDNDYRIESAKRAKRHADEDHEEVMELIRLLDVEHKLNHYAQMVESALGSTRKKGKE